MTENGLPALAGGYTPDDDIWWFSTAPDDMADPLNPVPGRQNLCESLIANASNAIISKTLQGIVTSWNPAAKEIFGYIAEEIIGRPLAMIIPASRRDEEAEILEKIRRGARIKNYETLVQRKNGELFPISVTVSPIRDADGKIIGAFRIVRDITEYMKALEILRSAEERYALALSGMRIGVWDWGLKAGKMFESERLRALIGPAPPEHVADCETFTGRIHQDDRQAVAERLRAHLEKREKFDVVYRMRVKDNQYVWVHTNGQAVWNESGTPVRMVGSIEDITQRHKLENNLVELVGKLKKSNKERDEFAYAASHDLKAPLRVIETTSQWLLEDLEPYLTQETRENMNLLRGRVIRMEKLLGDLLEYSRIGKAKDERFAQVVKGSELLDNIIELLSPDSGFSVLSDSGLAKIEVMRMPLQQVLMNLIDNAMKHHEKRTGTIKIGLEDIGPVYEFTVEDDGPGIPAEFHDKIFEMFRTLRPRDQVEGSGMGLAMVRKNVEMFGGSITVQSGPGQPIPFHLAEIAAGLGGGRMIIEPERLTAQLQLLHVEDDDGEAKFLQRAFAREFARDAYAIKRVYSLHEALLALQYFEFHAVLLDLGLNDASGLDGLNAIKEEHPDLPVVILSGHNDSNTALKAVRGGAQEYVVKAHSNSRMLALSVLSSIERKRYERHLFRIANHDALTGLPNRRSFLEYMKRWLLRAERWQRTEAIMFMGVDGFKTVNDTLGHDFGDELLIEIAARLKIGLRASDMLARYGGDEFIVHLDMSAEIDRVSCAQLAEKISSLFDAPVHIGGKSVATGLSIGIAFYPDDGNDTAKLIQRADEAMYIAKRRQMRFAFADVKELRCCG